MRNHPLRIAGASALSFLIAAPAFAGGVTVYKQDGKYVKLGGRIQMQYHRTDVDNGGTTDELFFRRFRPYIEGSIHPDWKGKFQFDLGKAEGSNEVAVKDAYMQYLGIEGMKITLGNAKSSFSREFLTSSKKQQLVERTFVGDHNYGTPDRSLGLHLAGHAADGKITWGATAAQADIDPDAKKLDFDSPVNRNDDFNEGRLYAARVDFHPLGKLKFSQGAFKDETRATIGVAAFRWSSDGDVETYTNNGVSTSSSKADVDQVTGYEISGALRVAGLSVDAQYNKFSADTVDDNFTGGLYKRGSTDLKNWALEGGYMVLPAKLEVVAGYQSQDADNYADTWTRTSVGANWYIHKHDVKVQATYRMNDSENGVKNADVDELFVQAQYVF